MFMDFLGYGNHVELYSEEISRGGEGLGVSRPAAQTSCVVRRVTAAELMAEHPPGVLARHAHLGGVQPRSGAVWQRGAAVDRLNTGRRPIGPSLKMTSISDLRWAGLPF
jgi:hypothetical protein